MTWTVASAMSRQQWARETILYAKEKSFAEKFMAENVGVIQKKGELAKAPGDHIDFQFLANLVGGGLTGSDTANAYGSATGLAAGSSYGADAKGVLSALGSTWGYKTAWTTDSGGYGKLVGREEPLVFYSDSVSIAMKRNGVRKPGRWLDQLTQDSFRTDAKKVLGDWLAEFQDLMMLAHLCGNTTFAFPTTALAPTSSSTFASNRKLFGGDATALSEISTGCWFSTQEIDRMRQLAEMSFPRISAVKTEGGVDVWPIVIHPYQAAALRRDTTWNEAQRDANIRGESNPIFSGAMGIYNGCVIHVHKFIYYASSGAGSDATLPYARAILLGKDAGCLATGWELEWLEDATSSEADYGDSPAVGVSWAGGFKKTVCNSIDYATIACDTYASNLTGTAHV